MKKTSPLWYILAAAFGALLVVLGNVWYSLKQPDVVLSLPPDLSCDLHSGSCTSHLPGAATVTFGVGPKTLPLMKPLELNVALQGVTANKVEVDFVGMNMNMGLNRTVLQAVGDGKFTGSTMLSICIRDSMDWEAKVLLYTPEGITAVPYRFQTHK